METISMSEGERRRLCVLSRVRSGELGLSEAGELLGLSYRQTKRVWRRYEEEGDGGVVHRSRGRPSNRQSDSGLKARALELYRAQYGDYGPTLASECLAEEDGLVVPASTLRRWLVTDGVWKGRRKRRTHRRRRERRGHLGELLQMDGSFHDWFEGRRLVGKRRTTYAGWATLMVLVDDATGQVFARFYEHESWESATDVFQRYVSGHGLPRGLYVDQHGIYRPEREATDEEILLGKEPATQFGRAMGELGVELILARSPQAKGRVERMNRTLQDRLVKALRRSAISDLSAANAFLEGGFMLKFNGRFSQPARERSNWHRKLGAKLDLPRILSIQESRVVQNDWTIRWRNRILQLPRESAKWVQPRSRVTVCEQLCGQVRVFLGNRELSWSTTRSVAARGRSKRSGDGPTGSSQGRKPGATHPWRGQRKNSAEGEA